MAIDPDVLVLPAFEELPGLPSERAPWMDAYDLTNSYDHAGLERPLRFGDGIGVVPTGIGKSAAATTVSSLLATGDIDLSDTVFLSVGVAGGPPARTTVGSVVIADSIFDWDNKVRTDPEDGRSLEPNPYNEAAAVLDLDRDIVEQTAATAREVPLVDPGEEVDSIARRYDSVDPAASPSVQVGTNCCADELWHGRAVAQQVETLADRYGCSPHLATEMEDAGTALALDRYGRLDSYLSVRGIANFDRPPEGHSPRESLESDAFEAGFPVAVKNAVRIGRRIVERLR